MTPDEITLALKGHTGTRLFLEGDKREKHTVPIFFRTGDTNPWYNFDYIYEVYVVKKEKINEWIKSFDSLSIDTIIWRSPIEVTKDLTAYRLRFCAVCNGIKQKIPHSI